MCHSISSCCWAAPSGPLYAERVMRREREKCKATTSADGGPNDRENHAVSKT